MSQRLTASIGTTDLEISMPIIFMLGVPRATIGTNTASQCCALLIKNGGGSIV